MAILITDNKEFQGVPLDSVYVRLHIQITIDGYVVAKPLFYANKKVYEANNKNHISSWYMDAIKKVPKLKEDGTKDGKKTVDQVVNKDICLAYVKGDKIENYKKLIPEVSQLVIDTLLEAGFVSDKKNIKIV